MREMLYGKPSSLLDKCPSIQITPCFLPLLPVSSMLLGTMDGSEISVYQNDLFLQLQDVISSLETCVLSWRSPTVDKSVEESVTPLLKTPSAAMHQSNQIQEFPNQFSIEDPGLLQAEIRHYQETNAVLRVKLSLTDRKLDKSRTTLKVFMQEKEVLQRKAKTLQDLLQDEGFSLITNSPLTSPMSEEPSNLLSESNLPITETLPCHPPKSSLQSLIQYLQCLPASPTLLTSPPEIHPSSMVSEMKWLKGRLDHVKQLNDQLSVTLKECKTDSEKLSMHLGKLESTCTALRLALQSSERCLKTYSVLLALAEAKGEILLGQVTSGDFLSAGWGLLPKDLEIKTKLFMMEVKKTFRREKPSSEQETKNTAGQTMYRLYAPWLSEEEEKILRDYIMSLKWDLSCVTVLEQSAIGASHVKEVTDCADIIKGKVDDAIKASVEALPCLTEKPARTQIMQELMDTKRLSELKASLQLLQTEKRALELQCLTQQEQEKAYMLIRAHLQVEQNTWTKQEEDSGNSKDEQNCTVCETVSVGQSKKPASSPIMQRLLDSLKQSSEIKAQIEGLTTELDTLSSKVQAQNSQSAQMIKDFFKAHRNLFLTYQNACRKYQEQQQRLEYQASLLAQRQCQQLQKLMQNIQSLQKKKIQRDTGETSL
ncbi:colorectal mutant cancer protein-like isoform X2 [Pseudophryne corroboree]|uniref:colorectal mutant cancer protein-like isoform X2 n=1 Tax=Pseudophryne corroboree TaxID=495146 RepID=UPI0030815CA2